MKILVTGATGTLGSKVVESLFKSVPASNLVVSVRNQRKQKDFVNVGWKFVKGILTDQ